MTTQKHLKERVRARMARTGESYATARRHVVAASPASARPVVAASPAGTTLVHFPGSSPIATALRILLAHAGVVAPHTKEPFTEAMVFGIGGGVGAGSFAFNYQAADFSSFFVAGRHLWYDDLAWLKHSCARFGVTPTVKESGGKAAASKALAEATAGGPAIAWVDMASLPYRGLPAYWQGGGYHLLTVYRVDGEAALVGDLADEPIPVPLAELHAARARIKKDRSRVLWLPARGGAVDVKSAVRSGLAACADGLRNGRMKNCTIEAFRIWGESLRGGKGKDGWDVIFPPGPRLWRGLWSIYEFTESWSGGGLARPLMAEFLDEAADVLGDARLRGLGKRYAELGRRWTDVARAALPDDVPALRATRERLERKVELFHAGGAAATEEIREAWKGLDCLGKAPTEKFPLSDEAAAALRESLSARVLDLYAEEKAALDDLTRAAA